MRTGPVRCSRSGHGDPPVQGKAILAVAPPLASWLGVTVLLVVIPAQAALRAQAITLRTALTCIGITNRMQDDGGARRRAIPAGKAAPVPTEWTTYTDEEKRYQLRLPKGALTDSRVVDGFDRFIASVPEPRKEAVMIVTFRESRFSKDELLEAAKRTLEKVGEQNIKIDSRIKINDDFELVNVSSAASGGPVTHLKLLLGTNDTNNYIVIIGSVEPYFKADEREIDSIWGSFVMLPPR